MEGRFQIRMGLIMKGGSSLAIYMNGMTQELHALTLAARALREQGAPTGDWVAKQKANPYYKLLKELGVDFVIDVISGTSAGGLNGLILAKALATGATDLSSLTDLWKETAQIGELAQYKNEKPKSLLNGEPMYDRLLEVMTTLSDPAQEHATPAEILDLFVTATDVHGHKWVRRDKFNQKMEGRAHKYLFHFRKRTMGYQHDDFASDVPEEQAKIDQLLAKVGRATSAFPGVFPPIKISRADGTPKVKVLQDIQSDYAEDGVWFSDGGILVNRPFEPVLNTVFQRSSESPVRRVLAFVEPDPDVVAPSLRREPTMIDTALAAFTLPMNQDILENLDQLRQENDRREQIMKLIQELEPSAPDRPVRKLSAIGQAQAAVRNAAPGRQDADEEDQSILSTYYTARARRLREVLRGALERALEAQAIKMRPPDGKDLLPLMQAAVEAVIQGISGLGRDPTELADFLANYDAQFHARRVRYLLTRLQPQLRVQSPVTETERKRAQAGGEMLSYLWGALEDWNNATWMLGQAGRLDERSAKWPEQASVLNGPVLKLAAAAAAREPLPVAEVIDALHQFSSWVKAKADTALGEALKRAGDALAQPDIRPGARGAGAARSKALTAEGLKAIADNFERLDVVLFPIQAYGREGELEVIGLYQFSPSEAKQWVHKPGEAKLAGDALGHFAGFLDQRWRSNDIMWGRLDCAELLVSMIVRECQNVPPEEELPEAQYPPAAQEVLRRRRRQIVADFPELFDMERLRTKARQYRPRVPVPRLPLLERLHLMTYLRLPGRQVAAAGALPAERPVTLANVPTAVLQDYLQKDYHVGQEGVEVLPKDRLAGELLLVLNNAAEALGGPGSSAAPGFLQKALQLVVRPLRWVAVLVLLPRQGLFGLAQGNVAALMTLVGVAMLVLWSLGAVALNSAGRGLLVALLTPAVLNALFRASWAKLCGSALLAVLSGVVALGPHITFLHWVPGWAAPFGNLWWLFAGLLAALILGMLADISWRKRLRRDLTQGG